MGPKDSPQYDLVYISIYIDIILVGGFNHLEEYERQWEGLSLILWKIKNDWNHQPVLYLMDHFDTQG